MGTRLVIIFWTALALLVTAGLLYCLARPMPVEWVIEHGARVRLVAEYARCEPVLTRWRAGVPAAAEFTNVWGAAVERPYIFVTESALDDLAALAGPDAVDQAVRRVLSVLLSPCTRAFKNGVVNDPLRLRAHLQRTITPACTSTLPVLYVCNFGETKDAALITAEASARQLDVLAAHGALAASFGVCSLLASVEKQMAQHHYLAARVHGMDFFAALERATLARGVDAHLLQGFTDRMRVMIEEPFEPDSITMQENRLELLGMRALLARFFLRSPHGYIGVQRVLPPANATVAATRRTIMRALADNYIDAAVVSPTTFDEWYRALLHAGLATTGVVWGLGMALILAHGAVRRFVLQGLGIGDGSDHLVLWEPAAPYRALLAFNAIRSAFDLIREDALRGGMVQITPARVFVRAPRAPACQLYNVGLQAGLAAPRAWRGLAHCDAVLLRAQGGAATRLRQMQFQARRFKAAGVPLMPLMAYGEVMLRGTRHACLLYAVLPGYTTLAGAQDLTRATALAPLPFAQRNALMAALAQAARGMHAAGYHALAWHPDSVALRINARGALRLRLLPRRACRPTSRWRRWRERVSPQRLFHYWRHELAELNQCLWPESVSVFNRARLLTLYLGAGRSRPRRLARLAWLRATVREKGWLRELQFTRDIVVDGAQWACSAQLPLESLTAMMTCAGATHITRKRGRTVVTLAAAGKTFYLKRHAPISLWEALLRRLRGEQHLSSAHMEWRAIRAVEALGIPAVVPVAMGESMRAGCWERGSFILTAELEHGTALETVLATRPQLSLRARRRLARRIALMAQRLQRAGYVHCDFYLGHIYLVGDLEGDYRLHLLDVQRLHDGARIGNRWSVKDISALHFSSMPLACISNADRLRCVLAYFGEARVTPAVRRFILRLTRKAKRTARHTEKLLARRRRRGELPPLPPPPAGENRA
jgi:hypothetical protein